jgi:hypothetical protein
MSDVLHNSAANFGGIVLGLRGWRLAFGIEAKEL